MRIEHREGPLTKSLLELLPGIFADGKRRASQYVERLESRNRVTLQTRELVIPNKDVNDDDLFRQLRRDGADGEHPNQLIYGDNLLAMAALVAGDDVARQRAAEAGGGNSLVRPDQ